MSTKSTQTRRMTAKRLIKVQDGLIAASKLEKYTPSDKNYDTEHLNKTKSDLVKCHEVELNAKNAYEAARDAAITAEWAASDFLIGVGIQAKAQYGDSSDAYASLGYKKKTAYKRVSGKKK